MLNRYLFPLIFSIMLALTACSDSGGGSASADSQKATVGLSTEIGGADKAQAQNLTQVTFESAEATVTHTASGNSETLTLSGSGASYSATAESLIAGDEYSFAVTATVTGGEVTYSGSTTQVVNDGDTIVVSLSRDGGEAGDNLPKILSIQVEGSMEKGSEQLILVEIEGTPGETLNYSASADAGDYAKPAGELPLSGSTATLGLRYQSPAAIPAEPATEHSLTITNSEGNSVGTAFNITITEASGTGTVSTQVPPAVLGISGIRTNDKIEWEADVEAVGTSGDLTWAWSYTSATGSAAFSVNNANPATMDGYDETASGTVTLTVTDTSSGGGITTHNFDLEAGQFPDSLISSGNSNATCDYLDGQRFETTQTPDNTPDSMAASALSISFGEATSDDERTISLNSDPMALWIEFNQGEVTVHVPEAMVSLLTLGPFNATGSYSCTDAGVVIAASDIVDFSGTQAEIFLEGNTPVDMGTDSFDFGGITYDLVP